MLRKSRAAEPPGTRDLTVVSTSHDAGTQTASIVCDDGLGATETITVTGPLAYFPAPGDLAAIAPDGTVTFSPADDGSAANEPDTLSEDRMGAADDRQEPV